jgi:hypothetical protein
MGANKVIILGLNIEKTGYWGSSFLYHFAGCGLAGGWLVGRSVNKCQLAPLNIPPPQKKRTLPLNHSGD